MFSRQLPNIQTYQTLRTSITSSMPSLANHIFGRHSPLGFVCGAWRPKADYLRGVRGGAAVESTLLDYVANACISPKKIGKKRRALNVESRFGRCAPHRILAGTLHPRPAEEYGRAPAVDKLECACMGADYNMTASLPSMAVWRT